jgi:hypothetical protein
MFPSAKLHHKIISRKRTGTKPGQHLSFITLNIITKFDTLDIKTARALTINEMTK